MLPLWRASQEYDLANLTGPERAQYVQGMFTRIAHRYDLMNRLMTVGQDTRWRSEVIHRTALPPEGRLLDLGAGTGDLAEQSLSQFPDCHAVAADFTLQMMWLGKRRSCSAFDWTAADALMIPFSSEVFDAVVSGFLLRNVTSIAQVLNEQYRVLKPGGRIVALDTTRPPRSVLSPLIGAYMMLVIPIIGQLVAGERDAYTYLPDSTASFLSAEHLAARMAVAGFREVGFRKLMFGTIAIHWGKKEEDYK
jgi:demethylmenaquinone methyltransferase/2-methoxy-6-polyprenyl-1,4-benzoquinol methylase